MTYGSLFSGVGGIDLGLDRAGLECKWQVENDPYAVRVLEKHWPGVKRYGDITQVRGDELEPVDLICGGFPCQDLSQAGKRVGIEGTRSGLWFEFARILGVLRPRFVLIENVPGLLVPGAMSRVVGELARLGYVGCWRSLRASEFGASHLRKRVFIVAYSSEAEPRRIGGLFDGEREARGNDADGCDQDVAYRSADRHQEFHSQDSTRGLGCNRQLVQSGDDVAYRQSGGLGELRQPSGCNGFSDGSHTPLAYTENNHGRLSSGEDDGGRRDSQAGGYSGVLADTLRTGLEVRDGKREQQLRRDLPAFAPGPSDPRWPYILRERPDLAPALGNPRNQHAVSGRRRQVGSQTREESSPGNTPAQVAGCSIPGTDGTGQETQSTLRGVADGIPDFTHGDLNDQIGSKKSRAETRKSRKVPALRPDSEASAASSGLLQTARRDDSLPAVPHDTADEGRYLGERSETSKGLQSMRQELYAASFQEPCDLRSGVPQGDRVAECDAPLALAGANENLPMLPNEIPVCALAPDNVQQELRQQTGMDEQAYWDEQIRLAMTNRTKRLGRLGNSVVPQCAEWVGCRIREFDEAQG